MNWISVIDNFGSNFMLNINNTGLTYGLMFFTNAANALTVICILILMRIIWGKKIGRYAFLNLAFAFIINFILKNIIRRARPDEFRIINASGYSFPSAHSMVGIALYGFLMYIVHTQVKDKKKRIAINTFLGLLIATIGISRIYLGVHYTTDVIGGYLAGFACVFVFVECIYKSDKLKKICTYDFFKKDNKKNKEEKLEKKENKDNN